jgi:hypothetical protein
MENYFYSRFPAHLQQLRFSTPNPINGEAFDVTNVPFFGGPDWENAASDLGRIPPSDRGKFVLALFMVVLTDQALFTNSRDSYERWRRFTAFPKFGSTGFGIHNENPLKLLWAPEKAGLVDVEELIASMPGFVEFMISETGRVIAEYGLAVTPAEHFQGIKKDAAYKFNEGKVVAAFKAAFEGKTGGN